MEMGYHFRSARFAQTPLIHRCHSMASDKRELTDEGHVHTLWEPAIAYAVYIDEQNTGLICGLQNVYYGLE